jgi:hypothetical protein
MRRLDWFDLRNMVLVARTVAEAALRRTESRGAHQREDFPGLVPEWQVNQFVRLSDDGLEIAATPPSATASSPAAGIDRGRSEVSSLEHQQPTTAAAK